jgi:hypothetical protein
MSFSKISSARDQVANFILTAGGKMSLNQIKGKNKVMRKLWSN